MTSLYLSLLVSVMLPQPSVTILALGDSYTIGESVLEADRWPNQLQRLLRDHGIETSPPEIVAKTGWTTDELENGIKSRNLQESYDIVTLLIGVNNQYRGRSSETYRKELRNLIQFAIQKAQNDPTRVILLSIPDWGVTPFAEGRDRRQIAREIDTFNQVKKEEAVQAKVNFIDITDISRDIEGSKKDLIASDGLHPSAKMYLEWAKRAVPVVKKRLQP